MGSENMTRLEQLLEDAKRGNSRAFNDLIQMFQKRIFTMALVITKDMHDADDVTQDVFITLYNKLSELKDSSKFEPWLIKITINRAKDFLRHKKVLKWIPFLEEKARSKNIIEDDVYHKELNELLEKWEDARLSPRERIAFQLKFGEEMSIDETAKAMNISPGTVKSLLHRAATKLRPDLRKLMEEGHER